MAGFQGRIRPLLATDEKDWLPLWTGYLDFYESSVAPNVTATTFARLTGSDTMFGLVAEQDYRLVGIAHAVVHLSTWTRGPYVYLSDLFVAPTVRGAGAGRALIEALYARADQMGAERVYWLTHYTNATARALYDKVAVHAGFIQYRR